MALNYSGELKKNIQIKLNNSEKYLWNSEKNPMDTYLALKGVIL